MTDGYTTDLIAAHDEIVAFARTIPDAALDWQPSGDDWSLKQIIGHLAHANDFYVMIVEQARASNFSVVKLHADLPGVQRMHDTDAAVARCKTIQSAVACFEHTFAELLRTLEAVMADDRERPFAFYEPGRGSWQSDAEPDITTIWERVIQKAASHIREHIPHVSDTLARWRAATQNLCDH